MSIAQERRAGARHLFRTAPSKAGRCVDLRTPLFGKWQAADRHAVGLAYRTRAIAQFLRPAFAQVRDASAVSVIVCGDSVLSIRRQSGEVFAGLQSHCLKCQLALIHFTETFSMSRMNLEVSVRRVSAWAEGITLLTIVGCVPMASVFWR